MSDLCMYELEDIAWDEFCQNDDHIVPHRTRFPSEHSFQGASRKKLRRESVSASCVSGNQSPAKYVNQENYQGDISTLSKRKNTMLEKGLWSHSSDVLLSSETNSMKEASNLESEKTGTSGHNFKNDNVNTIGGVLCADGPILSDKNDVLGDNPYSYPLGQISQIDDLNFFDSNYGWPDIENFEDVDRMFSCDSTFGIETGNEGELGWFSSSEAIEGAGDGVKFSVADSRNQQPSKLTDPSCSMENSNTKVASESYADSSKILRDGVHSHLSYANGSSCINDTNGFEHQEQAGLCTRQIKHQHHLEEKQNMEYLETGASYHAFTPIAMKPQKQVPEHDSSNHLHSNISYMHPGYNNPSEQTSIGPKLSVKSENNVITSLSPKESSYASNQFPSLDSSPDPSFQLIITPNKNREKQFQHSGTTYENQNDNEGASRGVPAELPSSTVQECTSMSSEFDEISLEAASFRQLQQVMQQLDIRTKLCIRDSLYRLARSAEQRHKHVILNGGCGNGSDTRGTLVTEGSNKFPGYVDMETDTNPIDRSIAHLLFHRPRDASSMLAHDSASFKSPAMCR